MSDEKDTPVRVVDRRWWARADKSDDTERTASTKPTYVEELERRAAEASEQLQSFIIEHRRSLDEFEQAKIRIRRDVARDVERGKRAILAELLDVVDNLDRAIEAARQAGPSLGSEAADRLVQGVELVRGQFLSKLESFGVARVSALGTPFDATRHEAVSMQPVDDPHQDGMVVALIREGYAIGDDLLRAASVVVGRHR